MREVKTKEEQKEEKGEWGGRDFKKEREKTRGVFKFFLMYQYPTSRNISSSST
jgi:hypothetical protein